MLSKKVVLILLALCCLLFAALFYTKDPLNITNLDAQEVFIPGLSERLSDVKNIQIDSQEGKVELVNIDEKWLVKSKDNYPATVSAVRQLLYGVAELEILEVKTSNELLLGEIGLAKGDDDSIRVIFNESDGDPIADILFGKSSPGLSQDGNNWFVRQYKSPQAWLVNGDVNLHKTDHQWLNKNILLLEAENLKQVELNPETPDSVRVIKSEHANSFSIDNLGENEKVESFEIEQLVDSVSNLRFDNVRPRTDAAFSADIQAINVETTDGLIILILVTDAQEGWIVLQAIAISPDEDVNQKAETYNQLWTDWEYQLPKFKIEQLLNKKQDLLSSEESS